MFNALLTRIGVTLQSKLVSDERGATAVEYGLIVGLIAVVIIGAVGSLGGTLLGWFNDINDGLEHAVADLRRARVAQLTRARRALRLTACATVTTGRRQPIG